MSIFGKGSKFTRMKRMIIRYAQDVPPGRQQELELYSGMELLLTQLFAQNCPGEKDRSCLVESIQRRLIAKMSGTLYFKALTLVTTGQCALAMIQLDLAITRGHLPSRALKAWMLLEGREGVSVDRIGAFALVEEGARLGCHHCQGVLASCYRWGWGCKFDVARSLELACESSERGSRYGQYMLGVLYKYGDGGLARDVAQAVALIQLAVAQNLDWAQWCLGNMYNEGLGVTQNDVQALQLYQIAASQGHPDAMYWVALCYEIGSGVRKNKAEAIRWYERAHAASHPKASYDVWRLTR